MRPLRALAPLGCLAAIISIIQHPQAAPPGSHAGGERLMSGPKDVLYAAVGDANYAYGPSMREINARVAALAGNLNTANFQVTYDAGFNANSSAKAAFQAAVNIWQTVITSPFGIPIKVNAKFDNSFSNAQILGSAAAAAVCPVTGGLANAFYSAALANVKNNNAACADSGGFQIEAHFNSTFANWDFGTTGTPVSGLYNFQTVVLHELAHGLGFYGSMQSAAGIGNHFYDGNGNPGFADVFDKFVVIGGAGGAPILSIPTPSQTLHSYLTGNNLFFSGTSANANNSGVAPKIESHNMTTQYGALSDNGFLEGSSYSHVDDVLYSPFIGGTPAPNSFPNGLMTWQLNSAEVYTDPGPILRGVFADEGWTIQSNGCIFSIAQTGVTVGAAGSTGTISLTASPTTCTWTAASGNTSIATVTPATGTGNATGAQAISYTVLPNANANQRSVNLSIAGQIFSITQNGTAATMAIDKTSLAFSAVNSGTAFTSQTGSQVVRLTQTGTGTVSWTATADRPWLQVSPASGSGSATLTISTQFVASLAATQSGTITIALTGAGNTVGPVNVTLSSIAPSAAAPPFGSFDTPANGATGIAGSIAVTGWGLDDVGLMRVTICRDAVTGETAPVDPNCAGNAKIYIGDAIFVDGARPDVQASFPTLPLASRAGWGYLMLTNFLPGLGNGTFTIYAYAFDVDGHTTGLGNKMITCNNAASVAPFGAIDVPAQGGVVSGSAFAVTGWVLAPAPARADPPGGGVVHMWVDGTDLGVITPGLWTSRSDLQALFPAAQFPGINTALGVQGFNTTTLTNGVHTIFWLATGTGSSGTSGIGSRFVTVSNGSVTADQNASGARSSSGAVVIPASSTLDVPPAAAVHIASAGMLASAIAAAPSDLSPVQGRRGYDLDSALRTYSPSSGRIDVQAEELDRIELHLSGTSQHQYTGYLQTAAGLRPLPVGSSLDAATGAFTWMPGVGFYGVYDLTFVRWSGGNAVARQDVRITLNAKGSNRVGPQTIIDAPGENQLVGGAFYVGGWAADLNSSVDSGVNTVHVWAYPVDGSGTRLDPIFLGPATYGGTRPDVAAVYGARFGDSGFGLIVNTLPPGTYDIAVFAYSTVLNTFTPAKVVRVTVR